MDQAILVALVMLVCVLTMLVLGIPISISIGLASTIAMLFVLPFENAMGTAAQKVFTGVNSFSLLAIPFFILAGNIMNNGGIAIRLVNCAKILSGRMPGALAETNVVANMLFGAISGSGGSRGYRRNHRAAGGKRGLFKGLYGGCQYCIRTHGNADSSQQYPDCVLHGCGQRVNLRAVYGGISSRPFMGNRSNGDCGYYGVQTRIQKPG